MHEVLYKLYLLEFLVSITPELEDLYIQYWGSARSARSARSATHNKTLSLQIKRKQIQFSIFLNFAHKKYKLDNKDNAFSLFLKVISFFCN
jgi:hypothetical protein